MIKHLLLFKECLCRCRFFVFLLCFLFVCYFVVFLGGFGFFVVCCCCCCFVFFFKKAQQKRELLKRQLLK